MARWPKHISRRDLDTCLGCGWPYPAEILSPFVSSDPRPGDRRLCAICGLRRINEVHGTDFKECHGETAEDLRQDALDFRHEHPECDPKR